MITFAAAPADEASGDGEVNAIVGDGFGEADGCFTLPTRSDEASAQKGFLCAQDCAFNLHAARRVTGNDKQFLESPMARETLCRYILRPRLRLAKGLWPTSVYAYWKMAGLESETLYGVQKTLVRWDAQHWP